MIYKENDVAIKAVKDRVIHGVGVRFGSPETKDYDGEWFHKDTEVGLINGANRPYLIEHGWNRKFGKAKVGDTTYEKSEDGWDYETIFVDTPLGNDAYNLVINAPYRSSAGAAGHTRTATMVKGTWRLDTWMIAEQSATLHPADTENPRITRVKSSEDYLLIMLNEMEANMEEHVKNALNPLIEAYEKAAAENRQLLANALTQLKESLTRSESHFEVSPDFLEELKQASQPMEIRPSTHSSFRAIKIK